MNGKKSMTKQDYIEIIGRMYKTIDENKDYLSKLDTEVGDGDHGFSMFKGFKGFYEKIDEFKNLDLGQFLKKGGFELIKNIGGASGAIFGTFFTGQSVYVVNNVEGDTLTVQDVAGMFEEALTQIMKRGNAKPGDKTMVDALDPAVKTLSKMAGQDADMGDAFKAAAEAAMQGSESTKDMIATRGRAKNVGERSRGFIDAGSRSIALLFKVMADYFSE